MSEARTKSQEGCAADQPDVAPAAPAEASQALHDEEQQQSSALEAAPSSTDGANPENNTEAAQELDSNGNLLSSTAEVTQASINTTSLKEEIAQASGDGASAENATAETTQASDEVANPEIPTDKDSAEDGTKPDSSAAANDAEATENAAKPDSSAAANDAEATESAAKSDSSGEGDIAALLTSSEEEFDGWLMLDIMLDEPEDSTLPKIPAGVAVAESPRDGAKPDSSASQDVAQAPEDLAKQDDPVEQDVVKPPKDGAEPDSSVEHVAQAPEDSSVEHVAQGPEDSSVEHVAQASEDSSVEHVAQAPEDSSMEHVAQAPEDSSVEHVAQATEDSSAGVDVAEASKDSAKPDHSVEQASQAPEDAAKPDGSVEDVAEGPKDRVKSHSLAEQDCVGKPKSHEKADIAAEGDVTETSEDGTKAGTTETSEDGTETDTPAGAEAPEDGTKTAPDDGTKANTSAGAEAPEDGTKTAPEDGTKADTSAGGEAPEDGTKANCSAENVQASAGSTNPVSEAVATAHRHGHLWELIYAMMTHAEGTGSETDMQREILRRITEDGHWGLLSALHRAYPFLPEALVAAVDPALQAEQVNFLQQILGVLRHEATLLKILRYFCFREVGHRALNVIDKLPSSLKREEVMNVYREVRGISPRGRTPLQRKILRALEEKYGFQNKDV